MSIGAQDDPLLYRKIAELTGLRQMPSHPVENYQGDARPECPIIDGLSGKSRDH